MVLVGCVTFTYNIKLLIGKREINQLKVECPNQESGCKWSGKLISLNEHISKDCQFRIVPCPNRCTLAGVPVMLLQQDVPVHITTVCSNRLINCPHCAKKVKHGELEAVHFGKCTKILIPCPNEGCTLTIERATLQTHRNSCEYESVPCKYAYIGCPAIVIRKDIETHENNYQIHLELALQTISKMKRESQRDHPLVEDDTTPTQLTGTGTEHPLAAVSTTQKDSASQTPDLLVFPNVRYGTVTTFKVNNFTHLKSTNQIHYSPPFYSHPGGYKLCVAVHTNGTTAGHGSHLSLVVHVMHGENDRNLPWPFTGELVVELLNQDEDKYHYKKHLKFPSKLCDENTRVMTGNRNQSGFGYPKYIPHHVLQENVRPSYMANDTLFFRVSANATVRNSLKPWLTCTT